MRNARRLLAALLAVVMLIPSILVPGYAAETTGFKDVREDSWYADAVDYVSAAGYMKGTSKDAFSPGEDVTRAMFVTILSRVARAQTDNTVSAFGDVAANQYYSGAIEWAAEKEIVNGVGGGLFAPYRSITRQDLAVMLYRFVNAMGYELSAGESRTYTDEAAISAYAADAVRFVTSTGLFAGYQDGSFRPKATATRAQTAVIVMRLAQLLDGQIVDPEPMPAQSFDQTSEQMQVSVNAPEGALPENTEMTVSRVTDEAALAELASKVGAEVLGAADISFAKDGAELEPARKVSVRISLDALQSAKNPAVVHVKDDGSFEYVSSSVVTTRGKADAIEFEADSFSVYAVTDNQTNATLTISFYAQTRGTSGGWEIVNKQIIRANQLGTGKYPIADPGVPGITTSQAFEGWIQGTSSFNSDFTYGNDATTKTVKQINEDYQGGLTGNTEIVYYAAVYDVIYVTYHDQAGAVLMSEFYHKNGSNQASVTINWPYVPFTGGYTFTGWTPDIVEMGNAPTYSANPTVYKNGKSVTISATLDLYPYVQEGHWITFDNNLARNNTANGFDDPTTASYTAPVFSAEGENPTPPTNPERPGYTFDGWYANSNLSGSKFNFNTPLTADTTLYAKWTPSSTTYTIVYWAQIPTDDKNATDANKHYEYYKTSSTRDATSCSPVRINKSNSGTTADNRLGGNDSSNIGEMGFGFKYNSNNTASKNGLSSDTDTVKVRGDGGTIINVYYDRKTISYTFKTTNYGSGTTYSGLFHSELSPVQDAGSGYQWYCTDISMYIGQTVANFQYFQQSYRDSYTFQKQQDTSTNYKTVHEMVQGLNGTELSGTWIEGTTVKLTNGQPILHIPSNLFPGFKGYRYNVSSDDPTGSGSGAFPQGTDALLTLAYQYYSQYPDAHVVSGKHAYVYFSRNQYTFTYHSNHEDLNPQTMYYGAPLTGLKDYVPTNGPDDCFFDGWYLDSGLVQPFNFNSKMPVGNLKIFAKWTPKKFRVILNNVSPSDGVTAPSGAQASFLVNAGERIDKDALECFTCNGKQLLGWYTDPEFKHPFNPESLIYDTVSDVNTYYGEKMPDETDAAYKTRMAGATRRDTDAVTGDSWSDNWDTDHPESAGVARTVRSQLQLYAKWRVDPEGVVGIKVRYLGDHAENDKGYFDSNEKPHSMTLQNPVFTDGAKASAHSATVPAMPDADTPDVGRRFLYWEILDKFGNPTGEIVYPGAPFTIDINKAVEIKTPLPDPNCTHTNEGASTIASVAAVAPTCTGTGVAAHYKCTKCGRLFTDANGANETTLDALTVSATGHDWNTNRPTYEWSVSTFNEYTVPTCTATVVCHNDETHELTETVTGQLVVNGTTGYYLAEFEDEHFADQQSRTFTVNRIAVTFKANGETIDELTQLVTSGQTVTLPGSEYLPAFTGYTFVGWVQAVVSDTTNAPDYKDPGERSEAITAPTTFYALYSHDVDTGSGTETVYELLTEEPDNWAGKFVISYGKTDSMYVLKGLSSNAVTYETTNGCATLTAAGITRDGTVLRNVSDLYVFETGYATDYESYRCFQNVSTRGYLSMYKANSSSDTQLYNYSSEHLYESGLWQPAYNTANGNVTLLNYYYGVYTSDTYPYVSFNSSGNYFYSGSSSGTNTNSIYLWKETQVSNTVPSYTTNPGSGGNAVTQPNLSSGKADSSANLINLSANANPNPVTATTEYWEETSSIVPNEEYLIGIQKNGNVYLIVNYSPLGNNYYVQAGPNYDSTYNDYNTYLEGYTALAVVDSNGHVTGVNDTTASGLSNCTWKFSSSTGGTITSAADSTRYLYGNLDVGTYNTYYSNYIRSCFPYTTATTWIWNSTYSYLYASVTSSNYTNYRVVPDYYSESGTNVVYSHLYNGSSALPTDGSIVHKLYRKVTVSTPTTYNVTVASGISNGTVTADVATAEEGDLITLTVTPDTGYELSSLTVTANGSPVTVTGSGSTYTFTMPAANVTVSATFTASSTPEPGITTIERWVPVNNVEDGEDYLIGFVYDGNTYLGLNYSPNTTNHYYYSYKFATDGIQSSNNTFLGYTGTPIFDGVNITGVEGNTTNLEHATWTFNTTNGGYYVVSKHESNRYLYAKKGGSSSSYSGTNSLYWDQYPNTTANVWTWDATNHHLYNTTNSVYAGVYTVSNSVYMTCEATNDTNYTNYIYVQLYKKEIINVYNVTLNPTENGTVRADKSTATAGETVKLTLTPNDGYQVASVTVTDSNGATVPVTGTSGIFTFTMPASNVTVSATFTNVIPDDVWIVSFRDENGKPISGMNDVYVPKNTANNLPESALPDPAKEDHYFLGWYQGDTKCTFPMTVNSDIVLTPKYSPMYAYDYTITLRAVYGPFNPDATTHIYWYANNGTDAHNGAGERFVSTVTESGSTTERLPINAQVDIPYPTGSGSQLVFAGDNGGALTWEDHVFLGWARVDNGGTADAAEARILTPDDIYLKWTGTEYEVRNDDGTYSRFSSQKVYADETTPYHDMYAVWAGFYYIYHSSDGTLEAVQVPFDARDTKNLVDEAESKGCLYGGYYKSSGAVVSVDAAEMRAAKDSILNQQNFWNYTDSCVASGSDTDTSLEDYGAVVYDGTSVKHTVNNVTVPFWQKGQAYTALGTELAPTAGTVYYLKEVPADFLPNKLVYVKADKNTQLYDGTTIEEGELTSLYLLTAVDDMNYSANGFMVGTAHTGQNVSTPDANSGPADTVSRIFTIFVKNGATYSYNANALNPSIVVPAGMNPNLVGFVAAKHLDYEWIQAHKGQTDGIATFYLKPYWTTLDGVTVTQDNIKGVNITADGKGISFVNVQ